MREIINHLTHIHLLNTIKSILTQTLEKLCKKRVYGKWTLTTCISETLEIKLIKASLCETEIIDCIQINKKHVYKERKETIHERVGERKTYINNIYEKISTMYVYKWSQDLMYKNNVSNKERKEKRYMITSLHPLKKNNNTQHSP